MKILTVCGGKGGIGKTITAQSIAVQHIIENPNHRCLLVDLDPSRNSSIRMIQDFDKLEHGLNISDLFVNRKLKTEDAIYPCTENFPNIDLIPSSGLLREFAALVSSRKNIEMLLKNRLSELDQERYNLVIIDCPPNDGGVTQNAIVACDAYITPFSLDRDAVDGILNIKNLVEDLVADGCLNHPPKYLGGFPSMFDHKASHRTKTIMGLAKEVLEDGLINIQVPRSVHVGEATNEGAVLQFQKSHPVARAYKKIYKHVTRQLS